MIEEKGKRAAQRALINYFGQPYLHPDILEENLTTTDQLFVMLSGTLCKHFITYKMRYL